ncbi:rhodanese-like domain-containing protein [Candidatus Legionella polyplacis]|uniref:Rhodanese-like domain-containing protein n=1 Tax=Candidatus Legionella polyplacis TaxID=2005262 RepID=A0ABZ2H007_9GAMM
MNQTFFFINKHPILLLLLTITIISILINEIKIKKNQPQTINPKELIQWINYNNAIVIDLRNEKLFKDGHIINSIKIQFNQTKFEEKKLEKYKKNPLILTCSNGLTSMKIGMQLKKNGFSNIMILSGGISNWINHKLPLIKNNIK